jgi:putative addiction module component (TIGR02574 family)
MPKINIETIIKEALEKSDEERAKIAEILISSLEEETDLDYEREWQEEIDKRLKELDSGSAKTLLWDDVYKKLYGKS